MLFLKLLYLLLINPDAIRISFTRNPSGNRFMVVSRSRKGQFAILFSGNSLPWYLKYMLPVTVDTEAGSVPFFFCKNDSANGRESPTETVDTVLPGFSPDDCISVENVTDSAVITATTTLLSVEKYLSSLPGSITAKSVKPPLHDLSQLYARFSDGPFILWKFTERGSVAGYIENGFLVRSVISWIGTDDLKENPTKAVTDIDNYINELSGSKQPMPILFYPETPVTDSTGIRLKYGTITKIPDINALPPSEHELFAIATSDNHRMNVVPYENINDIEKVTHLWRWIIHGTRILLVLVASILFGILSSFVFQKLSQHLMNDSLHELNTLRTTYTFEKSTFDSLKTLFLKSAGHIQKESAVTTLLNTLQHLFPDGMWAEEITIIESGESTWKLTIRALSSSSELLPVFNSNFQKIPGTVNHRVIYSESTTIKNSQSATIRIKVECDWR
jgi:hypothetical protein